MLVLSRTYAIFFTSFPDFFCDFFLHFAFFLLGAKIWGFFPILFEHFLSLLVVGWLADGERMVCMWWSFDCRCRNDGMILFSISANRLYLLLFYIYAYTAPITH